MFDTCECIESTGKYINRTLIMNTSMNVFNCVQFRFEFESVSCVCVCGSVYLFCLALLWNVFVCCILHKVKIWLTPAPLVNAFVNETCGN